MLQFLYERRREGLLPFGQSEQAVPPPAGINRRDWLRAVAQLSEYRLIDKGGQTSVRREQEAGGAASSPQQQAITEALEKVITAINQAEMSEQEKNEAKSLLLKLLSSKAAAKVLGAGVQSLTAEYFKR